MSDWYLPLKQAHVALVGASGQLFATSAVAVLAERSWPMGQAVRRASVAIDSTLLSAGVALWLLLGLLLVYILLGSYAPRRARTHAARALCGAAALGVLGTMVSVALTCHPLGWLSLWTGA